MDWFCNYLDLVIIEWGVNWIYFPGLRTATFVGVLVLLPSIIKLSPSSFTFCRYGVWNKTNVCLISRSIPRSVKRRFFYGLLNLCNCLQYGLTVFCRKYTLFGGALQAQEQTILISSCFWLGKLFGQISSYILFLFVNLAFRLLDFLFG